MANPEEKDVRLTTPVYKLGPGDDPAVADDEPTVRRPRNLHVLPARETTLEAQAGGEPEVIIPPGPAPPPLPTPEPVAEAAVPVLPALAAPGYVTVDFYDNHELRTTAPPRLFDTLYYNRAEHRFVRKRADEAYDPVTLPDGQLADSLETPSLERLLRFTTQQRYDVREPDYRGSVQQAAILLSLRPKAEKEVEGIVPTLPVGGAAQSGTYVRLEPDIWDVKQDGAYVQRTSLNETKNRLRIEVRPYHVSPRYAKNSETGEITAADIFIDPAKGETTPLFRRRHNVVIGGRSMAGFRVPRTGTTFTYDTYSGGDQEVILEPKSPGVDEFHTTVKSVVDAKNGTYTTFDGIGYAQGLVTDELVEGIQAAYYGASPAVPIGTPAIPVIKRPGWTQNLRLRERFGGMRQAANKQVLRRVGGAVLGLALLAGVGYGLYKAVDYFSRDDPKVEQVDRKGTPKVDLTDVNQDYRLSRRSIGPGQNTPRQTTPETAINTPPPAPLPTITPPPTPGGTSMPGTEYARRTTLDDYLRGVGAPRAPARGDGYGLFTPGTSIFAPLPSGELKVEPLAPPPAPIKKVVGEKKPGEEQGPLPEAGSFTPTAGGSFWRHAQSLPSDTLMRHYGKKSRNAAIQAYVDDICRLNGKDTPAEWDAKGNAMLKKDDRNPNLIYGDRAYKVPPIKAAS